MASNTDQKEQDIHLAAAVLSKRYEEQLFKQGSAYSRGARHARSLAAVDLSSSECETTMLMLQWSQPSLLQDSLVLERQLCCNICCHHAGEPVQWMISQAWHASGSWFMLYVCCSWTLAPYTVVLPSALHCTYQLLAMSAWALYMFATGVS